MNKGKLLILIGISGSGKSTYAHNLWLREPDKYVIVNRDKVRELLFGFTEKSVDEYYRIEKLGKYENQVTRYCDTLIHDGLNHDKTVIIDSTNLSLKYLNSYSYWNVPTDFKIFEMRLEDAIQRDLQRPRQVGEDVIEKQYARYRSLISMTLKEGALVDFEPTNIEMNQDNPDAFVFDIDGTLAHMNRGEGGRSPYDWRRVGEDIVDGPTREALLSLRESGNSIIICTGRDGICLPETKQWLADNKIPYDELMIREKGDVRPDWVIKELMWRDLAQDYNIIGMFDDRLQVVRRARALGLKVFNVEYNNF